MQGKPFIQKNNSKRALILAGGGMRLAYQAGVLQALKEAGLQFSHVDGTSGGIFNTAMLASRLEPMEMMERWRKLNVLRFMSPRPLLKYLRPLGTSGFGDADGIRDQIFPSLGIDLHKMRQNEDIDFTFNVCNFSNKSIEARSSKDASLDHLLAGVSLPVLMPALKVGQDWYSDAVWIKDANLMEAVKKGAEEIWLVWAIGNTKEYKDGAFNQYVHMIEMSAGGGLLEEFEQIKRLNKRIEKGDTPFGQQKAIRLHLIKPIYPLPLDPDLVFGKIDCRSLINMGYADTKRYLEEKTPQGLPFDEAASKMESPDLSLNFKLHFEGELDWKGKQVKAQFSTYINTVDSSRQKNKQNLTTFSSIKIEGFQGEMPTKDNQVQLTKEGKNNYLSFLSVVEWEGQTYRIRAKTKLSSSIDFFLGLEFKLLDLEIYQGENCLGTGTLSQNIKDRFHFVRTAHIANSTASFFKRKVQKVRMVRQLYF